MSQVLKPLPDGMSDFALLRAQGMIYVDKTDLIHELASLPRKKIFLNRPRRFGKSLLVSVFESLFKNGLRDFDGLKIKEKWTDKKYAVVRLDLSLIRDFTTAEEFREKLISVVIDAFEEAGFDPDPAGDCFVQLGKWLRGLEQLSLVVLIDEYDAPLSESINDKALLARMQKIFLEFYSVFKRNDGCLRFFFMTGITKMKNIGALSGINDLKDISMDVRYGTLLGYTEEELLHYFKEWLDDAAPKAGFRSAEELVPAMRKMYDGFCFDRLARTHVYAPWSVIGFLGNSSEGMQNFWYQSAGQPTVLLKHLLHRRLREPIPDFTREYIRANKFDSSLDAGALSTEVVLTQLGYFTIKESVQTSGGLKLRIGYPNKEVAESMTVLESDILLSGRDPTALGIPSARATMESGRPEDVVAIFDKLLQGYDYKDYPVRDECTLRGMLHSMLFGADLPPADEVHNAYGRSDLVVNLPSRCWVFEFKCLEDSSGADEMLKNAVEQIETRHYGEEQRTPELIRMALVFSKAERKFVRWKTVP